jgi:serine O-acetyltransferase
LNLVYFYRFSHWLFLKKLTFFAKLVYRINFLIFNSSVPPSVQIGKRTKFAYGGIGVVIHHSVEIGSDCIIGQGITIGGRNKFETAPRIGNKVYIGAGARILGPITIGNEVIISPNSVVIHDVPSNSIVIGIPAKITKSNILIEDFV